MSRFAVDPTMTLGEAIRALRANAADADLTEPMSIDSARAFDMHDAVHVIFGCDDSLAGEISAHVWMAFATTAPIGDMHRAVASREHRSVLRGIGHAALIGQWLKLLPRIAGILVRVARMRGRLPYEKMDDLKRLTVTTIRSNYRIQPL